MVLLEGHYHETRRQEGRVAQIEEGEVGGDCQREGEQLGHIEQVVHLVLHFLAEGEGTVVGEGRESDETTQESQQTVAPQVGSV